MTKNYARTYEEAINYLKVNYGFDGEFSHGKGFVPNYTIEHKATTCACGETDGLWVSDDELNGIEVIAICDACYEDATYKERV